MTTTTKPIKGYIAMALLRKIETSGGQVRCEDEAEGLLGALMVFKTKKAARKWYGRGVELCEIKECVG